MIGFSNGGAMAFRCATEMSDVFAAVIESSGTILTDTVVNPKRDLPIILQTGNSDDKFFGSNYSAPLTSADSLLTRTRLRHQINTHINSFNFKDTYTISAIENGLVSATYQGEPFEPVTEIFTLF